MSDDFNCPAYEQSILHSDDDYEPYGYESVQLVSVESVPESEAVSRFGAYEREIESMVLSRYGDYTGC